MLDLKPLKRKPAPLTEKRIEAAGKKRVAADGGESYKFTSPGRRAVPDQLELYGVEAMVQFLGENNITFSSAHVGMPVHDLCLALLHAAVRFTEYKAPGKKPTPAQAAEHNRLRERGFTVNVIDTLP